MGTKCSLCMTHRPSLNSPRSLRRASVSNSPRRSRCIPGEVEHDEEKGDVEHDDEKTSYANATQRQPAQIRALVAAYPSQIRAPVAADPARIRAAVAAVAAEEAARNATEEAARKAA